MTWSQKLEAVRGKQQWWDVYRGYLASPEWRAKADAVLARVGACTMCDGVERLDVDHLTYDRVGREDPADLTVLCRLCHQLKTRRTRAERRMSSEQKTRSIVQQSCQDSGVTVDWEDEAHRHVSDRFLQIKKRCKHCRSELDIELCWYYDGYWPLCECCRRSHGGRSYDYE